MNVGDRVRVKRGCAGPWFDHKIGRIKEIVSGRVAFVEFHQKGKSHWFGLDQLELDLTDIATCQVCGHEFRMGPTSRDRERFERRLCGGEECICADLRGTPIKTNMTTTITGDTTVSELALLLGKLGVRDTTLSIAPGWVNTYRVVLAVRERHHMGEASSIVDAFNEAIARLEHLQAHNINSTKTEES